MDKTIVDLTMEPEFDSPANPFLNTPVLDHDSDVIEIGHKYHLRSRISYKLNRIKMLIQEMEHDLAIGFLANK